jgi:hypothetical protein
VRVRRDGLGHHRTVDQVAFPEPVDLARPDEPAFDPGVREERRITLRDRQRVPEYLTCTPHQTNRST